MKKHTPDTEENLQRYIDRISFRPVESDPEAVFEKVRYKIRVGNLAMTGVSPVWRYIAVAASVALLIVSSLFLLTPDDKAVHLAYMEVIATSGSKTRVVLPDSSEVWLNSKARIRYPQEFTARNREVEFSGEALFTVAQNKDKPFVVNMDGMKIQVLGTVFNIHSAAETDIIETTLLEGSVAVYSGKNKTNQADRILKPEEQALYNRTNAEIEVRRVQTSLYTAWVDGQFYFGNNTFEEITRTLSRAFDVVIHVDNKDLKSKRFTAQFFHQETLDEILSILQISAKYDYRKVKGEIYISAK